MSVASSIFEASAEAVAPVQDDELVLQPMGKAVSGYAEETGRDFKTGQRLSVAELPFTHAVHIRRSLLDGVELNRVASITAGTRVYRVKNFDNQPGRPEVEFQCVMA